MYVADNYCLSQLAQNVIPAAKICCVYARKLKILDSVNSTFDHVYNRCQVPTNFAGEYGNKTPTNQPTIFIPKAPCYNLVQCRTVLTENFRGCLRF
jgi:hypothetical protein